MSDLACEWGDDWLVDSTGDLWVIDGDDEVRQRLERRLFSATQSYVWHPDYGAGLPQKIGDVYSVTQIKAICRAQLNLEATVAPQPPAQLSVSQQPGGLTVISIQYWDAKTGVAVSFQITA